MSPPPYRALQIVLRVFSVLLAVGGVFMILASKPLLAMAPSSLISVYDAARPT